MAQGLQEAVDEATVEGVRPSPPPKVSSRESAAVTAAPAGVAAAAVRGNAAPKPGIVFTMASSSALDQAVEDMEKGVA